MKENEFREWLEANGADSATTRDTRVHAVLTIEKKLPDLGLPYVTLEQAWQANRFEDVRGELSGLLADYRKGGQRFRIIMPQAAKPDNRLANWRSWLGQYGRFLSGASRSSADADVIREYLLEKYVEPARASDASEFEFVVKDVNDALDLNQAWPNICQAARGSKFLEMADVPPPESFGADMSTATRFRFDLNREDYWALSELTSRYGSPFNRTKKIAAFALPDGRNVALDLESARPQVWLEGTLQLNDDPIISVATYVESAPRNSNLPTRLAKDGAKGPVSLVKLSNAEQLRAALDLYDQGSRAINRNALAELKARFLAKYDDFEREGGFAGRSTYHVDEDDYKRALIAQARDDEAQVSDPAELGGLLLDLVTGKRGLQSNLLGRWMPGGTAKKRSDYPGLLERAAGEMVRQEDPLSGVIQFVEATWPTAYASDRPQPFGDSRTLPTMVAALVRPTEVVAIWTNRFSILADAVFEERLFGSGPLTKAELRRATQIAEMLFEIMRDDWGWKPRDLWDVQGFVWVTCKDKLGNGETAMSNEELLARFRGDSNFRAWSERWSESEIDAFCTMARAVHSVGLDWYHTEIPEVRFGRKSRSAIVASGTLGTLKAAKAALVFTHQHEKVGLSGEYRFDEDGAASFSADMEAANQSIQQWLPNLSNREGLWPDEYNGAERSMLTSNAYDAGPQNIILYGPPGTGKTWHTAEEAVRLCDGDVPSDRDALKSRYDTLVKEGRVRFVTFHQNFAYEEFVEGLRPETGETEGAANGGGFRLEPQPGIFRELCAVAEESLKRPSSKAHFDFEGRKFWKMGLGLIGSEDSVYEAAISGEHIALGWGGDVDWSDDRFSSQDEIRKEWQAAPRDDDRPSNVTQLHPFRNTMKVGDIVIVPYGNKAFRAVGEVVGNYYFDDTGEATYFHRRKVNWLRVLEEPLPLSTIIEGDFQMRSFYSIAASRVNKEALARLIGAGSNPENAAPDRSSTPQQFVMVIDEINRANISKVLGELITLIEPDKRIGMPNELRVQLPYSRREFGVPANLHIVGTMNTADRSIALMDTALRRRFKFVEMAPDTTVEAFQAAVVSTGLPLDSVLETMNRRIEYLVDRDHRIGHAFFIGCKTVQDVDRVMRDKIIPLLQEYFFDDWTRLAAVLGEAVKGGNFLIRETLNDPFGEGEVRASWRVKSQFDVGAYDRLVSSSPVIDTPAPAIEAIDE